jgi:hypothetical protein
MSIRLAGSLSRYPYAPVGSLPLGALFLANRTVRLYLRACRLTDPGIAAVRFAALHAGGFYDRGAFAATRP